jgi:long-chain acyl-CoA synthetase
MTNKSKKRCFFLTGATGLVGSYLLTILLNKGHKTFVLARGKDKINANDRILNVLTFWDKKFKDKKIDNLVVLEGDIQDINMGLGNDTLHILQNEIDEAYHSAAVTEINWPLNKIRRVNVTGTRHFLDLCLKLQNKGRLKKINHISTVYVCGNYKGNFCESDLYVGQQFNTTYEQSKYEAEKLVHEYRTKGLWIDIFRPPLITGDQKSGKITNFRNIYQFLSVCKLELFNELPVANCFVNIAPVDYVAQSIYALSSVNPDKNMTYHTFPNVRFSIEEILKTASRFLNFKTPKTVKFDKFDIKRYTPSQKLLLSKTIYSFNTRASLNSLHTKTILSRRGIQMGRLDNAYFKKMLKYFKTKK